MQSRLYRRGVMRVAWTGFAILAGLCGRDTAHAQATQASAETDVTETVAGATDEVTESVADVQPSQTPSVAASPTPGQASLHGWLRQTLEWTFNAEGYRRAAPDPLSVQRDRLLARTQLLMRAAYRDADNFEAVVSGLLELALHEQGPAGAETFTGINGQSSSVLYEAALREAYLGFALGPLDVRFGQQRVVWGHSYALSPNDVVNAHDLRDPFLGEPELRALPTPLLRADLSFEGFSIQAVVTPLLVPDRFDLLGSNWSPVGLDTPPAYRGLFNLMRSAVDSSLEPDLQRLLRHSRLPQPFVEATSAGVKLSTTVFDIDLNAYYHYGFDSTPFLRVEPSFAFVLEQTNFSQAKLQDLQPVLRAIDAGLAPFRAEYLRRHHVGIDAARALGPFVLRIEAAYQSARVFYSADLSSHSSPTLLCVLGLEYQPGAIDQLIALELVYVGLLDEPSSALIGYARRHSYGAAAIVRWPLFGVLSLNLRAIGGVSPATYVLQPALRFTLSGLAIDVGALVLDGEPSSVGWYYRRNVAAFVQARQAF
jgi:hypothetical protein